MSHVPHLFLSHKALVDPEIEVHSIVIKDADADGWSSSPYTVPNDGGLDEVSSIRADVHHDSRHDTEVTVLAHQLSHKMNGDSFDASFHPVSQRSEPRAAGATHETDPSDCFMSIDSSGGGYEISFSEHDNEVDSQSELAWKSDDESPAPVVSSEIDSDLQESMDAIREEASRVNSVIVVQQLGMVQLELELAKKEIRDRDNEIKQLTDKLHEQSGRLATVELERELTNAVLSSESHSMSSDSVRSPFPNIEEMSVSHDERDAAASSISRLEMVVDEYGFPIPNAPTNGAIPTTNRVPEKFRTIDDSAWGSHILSHDRGTVTSDYGPTHPAKDRRLGAAKMVLSQPYRPPTPYRPTNGRSTPMVTAPTTTQTVHEPHVPLGRAENRSALRARGPGRDRTNHDPLVSPPFSSGDKGLAPTPPSLLPTLLEADAASLSRQLEETTTRLRISVQTSEEARRRAALVSRYYEHLVGQLQEMIIDAKTDKVRTETRLMNELVLAEQGHRHTVQEYETRLARQHDNEGAPLRPVTTAQAPL